MTAAERKSNFKPTTATPYLALMGELWGVYYKDFEENWPRFNGTALFIHVKQWNVIAHPNPNLKRQFS